MTWHVVYESATGRQVSTGTVVANPLPDGLSAVALSEDDADALLSGRGRWDDATRTVFAKPQPVPATISPRQARLWLVRNGITPTHVDAVIASIPDAMTRQTVQIDWEYATEVQRASPFIQQLGPALGLDEAALDAAFREAASI